MDTEEYYGGTYPEPPEVETTNHEIKICITVRTNDDFPTSWNEEDIKEYVRDNISNYKYDGDEDIDEIEVD